MSKTIVITGSTDGIGKLVALKLAKEGHNVYIHGRNSEKLAKVLSEIKNDSDNPNVYGFVADFSDLKAVAKMGDEIAEALPKIDILINNAGIFKSPVNTTKDHLDIRFAVNYLAPYILTNKLLPSLKKGSNARIVNLSSAAQSAVKKGALIGKVSVPVSEAYAQSKLALTMWSFHLAKAQSDVSVVAVNPGSLLNTRMANEAYGQHWSPAEKGSDILYDLAITSEYADASGKYFDNDRGVFGNAHPDAYNASKIQDLLSITDEIIA